MTASLAPYPESAVVYISDQIAGVTYQGSGVLIAPNEVLTASHVVYSSTGGAAYNVTVTPDFSSGSAPVGTSSVLGFHYNQINDSGDEISLQQSQFDFAVIHLATSFTSLGTMTPTADYAGGDVTVSGYPAAYGGTLDNSPQAVVRNPYYAIYDGTSVGAGSSGGPVWGLGSNGQPDVYGLVSTGTATGGRGYFTQLNSADVAQISAWVASDTATASAGSKPVSAATSATVSQFYANILQRSADASGLQFYGTLIDGGTETVAQVDAAIATSGEARAYVVPIVELYAAIGRLPDAGGLKDWVHTLEGGAPLTDIAAAFVGSAEGYAIYGTPGTSTISIFINSVYEEALGRPAEAAGQAFWTSQIATGAATKAQAFLTIATSGEAQSRDAAAVTDFLTQAGTGTANYGGPLFAGNTVTADTTSDDGGAAISGAAISAADAGGQPIELGAHAAADTVFVASDDDAAYGSGGAIAIDGFTIGGTVGFSDRLEFLAGGTMPAPVTPLSGAFSATAVDVGSITATASAGVLIFDGPGAGAASLGDLLTATAHILASITGSGTQAAAFQYGSDTILVATPATGGEAGLAADHVFRLDGVTDVTALGTQAAEHTLLV